MSLGMFVPRHFRSIDTKKQRSWNLQNLKYSKVVKHAVLVGLTTLDYIFPIGSKRLHWPFFREHRLQNELLLYLIPKQHKKMRVLNRPISAIYILEPGLQLHDALFGWLKFPLQSIKFMMHRIIQINWTQNKKPLSLLLCSKDFRLGS